MERNLTSRIWVFWLLLALVAGLLGIYVGVQYEAGQAAIEREALKDAYATALQEANARRAEAQARGTLVERDFIGRLSDLKIVNTTIHQTLKQETQKLVYTNCVLPDAGIDLVNQHIDAVNLRLLGKEEVK